LCALIVPLASQYTLARQEALTDAELGAAINQLGNLDYDTRSGAARGIRRTPGTTAVPALLRAAAEHEDGYVRYRALVLLTGFNDPRTGAAMREALNSPNDRLRTVAYSFFEHHPDGAILPDLVAALERESAEFVRPALVRALAAQQDERVHGALIRETGRGEDFFRSVVIEALGDYKATYAFDVLTEIAGLDGPLQDDAALALGKIGDRRALPTLTKLRQSVPEPVQPIISASICMLNVDCDTQQSYLVKTLTYADATAGRQELLRGTAAALGALATAGHAQAVDALFRVGISSQDPTRAPVALAVATVALRNPPLMISSLASHHAQSDAMALLAEGFDMLEEDLLKERFFSFGRRMYWESPPASATAQLVQQLLTRLDF
jgi:HEAT repeat protein